MMAASPLEFELNLPRSGSAESFMLQAAGYIEAGQAIALFGPSGAGKTSLLRLIAGLIVPVQGYLRFGGSTWFDSAQGLHLATEARPIGMQFQQPALFPNMTAREQLIFAGAKPGEAMAWLEFVELAQLAHHKPAKLSGGQQQRLALARALARRAPVLLLDEPLAAQDGALRMRLQDRLRTLQKERGFSMIVASHDIAEIARMADQVWRLESGRIIARGTPSEVLLSNTPHGTVLALEYEATIAVVALGGGVFRLRIAPDEATLFAPGLRVAIEPQRLLPR